MRIRRRLTRQERRDVTRMRLIEAAERLFIRKGFDDASVDEISEAAGYSRGAFYSNFEGKDEIFLAVIDGRRHDTRKALDNIFQQPPKPEERIAAFQSWFSNQWRLKDFIALQMEFTRRAMKDGSVRKRLDEMRREELETYTLSVSRFLATTGGAPVDLPETVALVLWAISQGLGSFAMGTESEWEHRYTKAVKLAFDRMTAPQIQNVG